MLKKKTKPVEVTPPIVVAEAPAINRSVSVKVLNQGDPFVYDLAKWGYGQRWPTGAVYTISLDAFMDCLSKGMNGTVV